MAQNNEPVVNDGVFPDDEMISTAEEQVTTILPWKDVTKFTYFRVLSFRLFVKKDGSTSMVLLLQRRSRSTFEVWATSLIAKDIKDKLEEAEKQRYFCI